MEFLNGKKFDRMRRACKAVIHTYDYVGCYKDTDEKHDLPTLVSVSAEMTPLMCSVKCRGHKYFAVQHHAYCFCGHAYGTLGQASESECNSHCTGDSQLTCGGEHRNSVHRYRGRTESDTALCSAACRRALEELQADQCMTTLNQATPPWLSQTNQGWLAGLSHSLGPSLRRTLQQAQDAIDVQSALQSLEGRWFGWYLQSGFQLVTLQFDFEKAALVATKVTGNPNVPAGRVSFEIQSKPALTGRIQLNASPKHWEPEWRSVRLNVTDFNHFTVDWTHEAEEDTPALHFVRAKRHHLFAWQVPQVHTFGTGDAFSACSMAETPSHLSWLGALDPIALVDAHLSYGGQQRLLSCLDQFLTGFPVLLLLTTTQLWQLQVFVTPTVGQLFLLCYVGILYIRLQFMELPDWIRVGAVSG